LNSNFIIYSQTSSSWIPILLSTVKPRYLEFQFLLFLLSTVKTSSSWIPISIIYSQTSLSWIPISIIYRQIRYLKFQFILSTVKPRYIEFQFLLSTVKPRYIEFQFLLSTVKPRYIEFQFLLSTVKPRYIEFIIICWAQCSWLSLVPSNRKIHWTTKSKRRSVKSLTQPLGGRSTHAAHTKISTTSYYMYATWKVSHRRCKDGWQRLTWTRFKCRK
jgi:hypothetical protein